MHKLALLAAAASLSVAGIPAAHAALTGPELDAMAAERNAEMHPRPPLPRPPRTASREDIRQPDRMWVCMSADPWQPVYAAPRADAQVIGQTAPTVAVSGEVTNGFVAVLRGRDTIGFVPWSGVQPYHPLQPNGTCWIAGVQPDGSPVFGYR